MSQKYMILYIVERDGGQKKPPVFFIRFCHKGWTSVCPFWFKGGLKRIMRASKSTPRPDKRGGAHYRQYEINKKKILATQTICGICGKPVDMELKYPHPLSACIDHIIPIAKGGHPSDIQNLQLAHWTCNRTKSDKITGTAEDYANKRERAKVVGFRNLPLSCDWINA